MGMKNGDQISYCLLPNTQRFTATVVSVDEGAIALQVHADAPADLDRGRYIMIIDTDADVEYFSEIGGRSGPTLRLSRMWTGKRGYFRVDDVFPVTVRKIAADEPLTDSRIFSGFEEDLADLELPDDSINPRLWKLLVDMNAKLSIILRHLHLESHGLTQAKRMQVNISASGMRITMEEQVEIGDVLELKVLLPTYPPAGILVHGRAVRVEEAGGGGRRISLRFVDLAAEVQDVIIQYALKRQRELIRRHREQEG